MPLLVLPFSASLSGNYDCTGRSLQPHRVCCPTPGILLHLLYQDTEYRVLPKSSWRKRVVRATVEPSGWGLGKRTPETVTA